MDGWRDGRAEGQSLMRVYFLWKKQVEDKPERGKTKATNMRNFVAKTKEKSEKETKDKIEKRQKREMIGERE